VAWDRPYPPESRFLSHLFTPPHRLCFRVALLQNFSHLHIGVCCRFYKSYQHISWRAVFSFFPILRCRFVLSLASKYLSFLHQSISKHVRRVRRDRPRSMCHTYSPLFFVLLLFSGLSDGLHGVRRSLFATIPTALTQKSLIHSTPCTAAVLNKLDRRISAGADSSASSALKEARRSGTSLLWSFFLAPWVPFFSQYHQKSLSVAPSLPIGYFRV
jgi:hypothetical protein